MHGPWHCTLPTAGGVILLAQVERTHSLAGLEERGYLGNRSVIDLIRREIEVGDRLWREREL